MCRRSRSLRLSGSVVAGDSLKDLPAPQSRMRLAYGLWGGFIVKITLRLIDFDCG